MRHYAANPATEYETPPDDNVRWRCPKCRTPIPFIALTLDPEPALSTVINIELNCVSCAAALKTTRLHYSVQTAPRRTKT